MTVPIDNAHGIDMLPIVELESRCAAEGFMAEFNSQTWPNPFNNRERVFIRYAAFALAISFDDVIRIECIRSLGDRGQGNGSRALDWLCGIADRHGVKLTGTVQPVGNVRPRLNIRQLLKWYRRHGFMVEGRTIHRLPMPIVEERLDENLREVDPADTHRASWDWRP
jgi:hypothetical protein